MIWHTVHENPKFCIWDVNIVKKLVSQSNQLITSEYLQRFHEPLNGISVRYRFHNHGEECWLDSCAEEVLDNLYKEAKTQKSLLKKLAVHRELYPIIFIESWEEVERVVEKGSQATRITAPLRGLSSKDHSKLWSDLRQEAVHQEPPHAVYHGFVSCNLKLKNKKKKKETRNGSEGNLAYCSLCKSFLM